MGDLFQLIGRVVVDNESANKNIDETTDKAEKSESKLSQIGEKIGNGLAKVAKAGAAVIASTALIATTALVTLSTKAVQCYADYEQLVGGVETLFGAGGQSLEEYADSVGKTVDEVSDEYYNLMVAQGKVLVNANNAFRTAGLSANAYMETVTSFSAALISSLDGDTVKAAEIADRAIVDMSDNANKMGSSMESIQNAYQGFAKQNYTMLDNLKLGYGGTKEEMERLLEDAGKLANQEFDISSYADVVEAIHVIQENMGITGTTAKEAATTIQGSVGMMKAAWENFLTGMADPDQDFDDLLGNLVDSVVTVADNLIPRIAVLLPRLVSGLSEVAQNLASYIPGIIEQLLPALLDGVVTLTGELTKAIPSILSTLVPALLDALRSVIDQVSSSTGLDFSGIFESIVDGASQVGQMLQGIMPSIISMIQQLIPPLLQIAQEIIPVVIGLITELTPILMQVIESVVPLVAQLLSELIPPLLQIVQAILPVVTSLLEPIIMIIQSLVTALSPIISILGSVISQIAEMLMPVIQQLCDFITTVLTPIIQGILLVVEQVIGWVVSFLTENMGTIQAMFQSAIDVISGIINFFIALFTGNWSGMWDAIKSILNSAWDFIVNIFTLVKDFLASIGSAIWSVVQNAWENVYMAIYNKITKIKDSITNTFNNIKTTVSDIFTKMKDAITNIFEGIWSAIKGVINKILGGIESMCNGVIRGINKLLSGIESVANTAGELLGFDPINITLSEISLPRLAKGTVVKKPTIAEIGEDGAEAVVPLERNTQWIQRVSEEMQNKGDFSSSSEVIELLKLIIELLKTIIKDNGDLPDALLEAIANGLRLDIDKREFARLVKAV